MAQEKRDNRVIIFGNDVRTKIMEGATAIYDSVTTTYGPKGRNVLIEKPYGRPILTRDGVTVAKDTYFSDRAKNMAAQLILEASLTTNRVAGDGTTATVALTYNVIKQGIELIASGKNPMDIRDEINKDAVLLKQKLATFSKEVTKGQLEQVATVSSGDKNLGKMIASAVEYVGKDGGLITEKAAISGVEREYIEGYYLQQGFSALTEGRRVIDNPIIVASAKKISSNADFLELLNKVAEAVELKQTEKLRIAFIGEFEGQARDSILANILQGSIDGVIVETPSVGAMGTQYLEDIAIYTGGKVFAAGDNLSNFDATYIGRAERIICTPYTTSILGGEWNKEAYDERIKALKLRADNEESVALAEKFRDRLAKLQGKVAVFKIGGATETEKEEKEFRIEDAIQATKAAHSFGVVPGGASTLLRLSKEDISPLFSRALVNTFKRLMLNANLSPDVKVDQVLNSEMPMGINLRGEDKLVDLIKEGVLDPTLVVEQIIENASSIAGNALTIESMILFEDREPKS